MSVGKKILVSVTNDLETDQRVNKVCTSLYRAGYDVCLIGRLGRSSSKLKERIYRTHRMELLFHSGPFFYLNYNLSLLWFLLRNEVDILLSNDLDTLPANFMASRLKKKALVYDSHEYFTEVPELENRKWVKRIWQSLESYFLPKVDAAYTVSSSIADAYHKKYGIKMKLIRNFPVLIAHSGESERTEKIIIYQGAVNVHRGIEQMVEAMQWVKNAKFWIVGGGDIEEKVKEQIKRLNLSDKVIFYGRKPFEELKKITRKATIGISLEKQVGLNYTFALPNKLFDYIHAGVPVLASNLPEVKKIFEKYTIGVMTENREPKSIAKVINEMLDSSELVEWEKECKKASLEYNWQKEEKQLIEIFNSL